MPTLYFFVIVLFSCAKSTLTKMYSRRHSQVWIFNFEHAFFAFLMFFAASIAVKREIVFHFPTFIYSLIFAAALCVSMFSGFKALSLGLMSLTSLIVTFSLIIPCIYGICVLGEALTLYKTVGFILLIFSLILFNIKKESGGKISVKWGFYTGLTLVTNGICSIVQKLHQISYPGEYLSEFMRDAMLLCSAVFLVIMLEKRTIKEKAERGSHKYGILTGIMSGGANYFTLALSGMSDASALFPMISAGTSVAVFLAGLVFFGEKHSPIRLAALMLGVAAVVFLKM